MKVFDRLNAVEEQDLSGVVLGASAIERVDEVGEGSVTVPEAVDIGYRKVVRLDNRFEFRATKRSVVKVHERPEECTLTASGPGLLSWLQETLLLPFTGDNLPQPSVRHFGWPDPAIDAASDWNSTIYLQPRNNILGFTNRPAAWPEPFSAWLHWRAPNVAHPAETGYYARPVVTTTPNLNIYATASDQFELAWDGAIVQTERLADPGDNTVWPWTWRARLRGIPAGTHELRAKVDVINPTGAGGFLCVGFATSEVGIQAPLFATGTNTTPGAVNGGWFCLGNPANEPGRTAVDILRTGVLEAAARGCDAPTMTFTATHDSAGQPMPLLRGFAIPVPCTLWDLVRALGLEVSWDGWTLHAFQSRGGPSGAVWASGVDVLEHRVEGEA